MLPYTYWLVLTDLFHLQCTIRAAISLVAPGRPSKIAKRQLLLSRRKLEVLEQEAHPSHISVYSRSEEHSRWSLMTLYKIGKWPAREQHQVRGLWLLARHVQLQLLLISTFFQPAGKLTSFHGALFWTTGLFESLENSHSVCPEKLIGNIRH